MRSVLSGFWLETHPRQELSGGAAWSARLWWGADLPPPPPPLLSPLWPLPPLRSLRHSLPDLHIDAERMHFDDCTVGDLRPSSKQKE